MPLPAQPENPIRKHLKRPFSMVRNRLSRAFTAYGAGSSDIFQVSYGYGTFYRGLGAHAGAENIGGLPSSRCPGGNTGEADYTDA